MATTSGSAADIPIIDISGSIPEVEVAKQLVDAVTIYGFVYIKNEGKDIPVQAIEDAFSLSKKFFASPVEEKAPLKVENHPYRAGWYGMQSETLNVAIQRVGDFKELINFSEFVEGKAQQPLSPILREHEAEIYKFERYCHALMQKLLSLFAIGLEIDSFSGGSSWFSSRHTGGPSGATLRYLHYPSIPAGSDYQLEVDVRAGAHSDYGSITLLFQRPGQPGLEIIPPSTRTADRNFGNSAPWTPVPVFPTGTESDPSPPILVNIGDLLSHWTNNLFKSTVHRVVFPKGGIAGIEDRYSIAYFGNPVADTVLEPVPSAMVRALEKEDFVKAMTAAEHLTSRINATYL